MSAPGGGGGSNRPGPDPADPPDLFSARVIVTRETYPKLVQEFHLDLGCRPHVEMLPDGSGSLLVYATDERIRELQAAGYEVKKEENASELGRRAQAEVGTGDRFEGGRVAPRGSGQKAQGRKGGGPDR
jgi:hypothetical protein